MNFERATLLYYVRLKRLLGRSQALEAMIAEEKRHVVNVMRFAASKPLRSVWNSGSNSRLTCRFVVSWALLELSRTTAVRQPQGQTPL